MQAILKKKIIMISLSLLNYGSIQQLTIKAPLNKPVEDNTPPPNEPSDPPIRKPQPPNRQRISHTNEINKNGTDINSNKNLFKVYPLLKTRVEEIRDWNRKENFLHIMWDEILIDKRLEDIEIKGYSQFKRYEEIPIEKEDLSYDKWEKLKEEFPLIKKDFKSLDIDSKFKDDKWGKIKKIEFVQRRNIISKKIETIEITSYKFRESEKEKATHYEKNKSKDWWNKLKNELKKISKTPQAIVIDKEFQINPEGLLNIQFSEIKLKETGELIKIVVEEWDFYDGIWERFTLDKEEYPNLYLKCRNVDSLVCDMRSYLSFYSSNNLPFGEYYYFAGESWAESGNWVNFINANRDGSNGKLALKKATILLNRTHTFFWYVAIRLLTT